MTFDARTEKNLATLTPRTQVLARAFMERAGAVLAKHGLEARIISGLRTYEEQDALYAQGRTKPGPRVTNARTGYSNHNFGTAFDIGLFRAGKYLEEHLAYALLGPVGEAAGLEWGGRWKSPVDEPHYQVPGLSLANLRGMVAAGKAIA